MPDVETVDLGKKLARQRIAAKAKLSREELSLPERPTYALPDLRLDVTDVDDRGLIKLSVKFTRYQDHIAGLLAEVEIDETAANSELELAKAKYLAASWTGASGDRVAVQKAEALLDPDVQAIQAALEKCRAQRKLYNVFIESIARRAAVVSRELTRRTSGSKYS